MIPKYLIATPLAGLGVWAVEKTAFLAEQVGVPNATTGLYTGLGIVAGSVVFAIGQAFYQPWLTSGKRELRRLLESRTEELKHANRTIRHLEEQAEFNRGHIAENRAKLDGQSVEIAILKGQYDCLTLLRGQGCPAVSGDGPCAGCQTHPSMPAAQHAPESPEQPPNP